MTTEERYILENQVAIMTALLALLSSSHAAAGQLYYDIAKTSAYLPKRKK